jgi:hypothetical protein
MERSGHKRTMKMRNEFIILTKKTEGKRPFAKLGVGEHGAQCNKKV